MLSDFTGVLIFESLIALGLNFAILLSEPPWSRRPAGPDLLPAPLVRVFFLLVSDSGFLACARWGAFDGGFSMLDTIASVGLGPVGNVVVGLFDGSGVVSPETALA
ncbi:uncharacterized protein EDB91DRAFT_734610 [Suillus paluster]|uniref:uncharacterized protein n=1 Tax=Suillus paluster TaxID=48578 RepID=UPI001B865A0A|nr:uncharacterized protein EDB91DRAFT_734610 [Suillus paluster]KAG1731106.1 hypothetical protein EDB91DRAFT_734610 [Suillus paluster]